MGLGLELVDIGCQKKKGPESMEPEEATSMASQSMEDAQLYAYYEDLIREFVKKNPAANDKLALALIMSRGFRPTISKNRDLALLDIDKMISLKYNSLKEDGNRMKSMKLAADKTGLKNNLLVPRRETPEVPPLPVPNTENGGNFQIFRLIRAAQMHYLNPRRDRDRTSETDIVNNSQERIEEQ